MRLALDMYDATLGTEHPDVLGVRHGLARTLDNQGRSDVARVGM